MKLLGSTSIRRISIIAGLLVLVLVAVFMYVTSATANEPASKTEVPDAIQPPPIPTWTKDDFGDEVALDAEPVDSCPLTTPGCDEAEELLRILAQGDMVSLAGYLEGAAPADALIGGKPDAVVQDTADLALLLPTLRDGLSTVAVGCLQSNELGSEAGACDDHFVLAVDASMSGQGEEHQAVAFLFMRQASGYELIRAHVERLDVTRGGGVSGLSDQLPVEVTKSRPSIWYTPWRR